MSPFTFDTSQLLPMLRDYLRNLNTVRKPNEPDSSKASLYPMWLDPRMGIPYPGQTEDLKQGESTADVVVAAYPSTGVLSKPLEGFYRQKAVTIYIRARKSPMIQRFYDQKLYPNLHDIRNVDLGGLQVNQIMGTRDLQRISADARGYVYNCEFMFDLWGSDV